MSVPEKCVFGCPAWQKVTTLLLTFFAFAVALRADQHLILRLQHPPADLVADLAKNLPTQDESLLAAKLPADASTQQLAAQATKLMTPSLGGFTALYSGYVSSSSNDGLIDFPLRHSSPKVYIAITPSIKLIGIKGATISHRDFDEQVPLKLYQCEQTKDQAGVLYWHVTEIKKPDNNQINKIAVVILSDPNNLFMPEGDFKAADSNHLMPPPIYVLGTMGMDQVSNWLANFKEYFEPIQHLQQKASDTVIKSRMENF